MRSTEEVKKKTTGLGQCFPMPGEAALISLLGVGISFIFLVMISKHSLKNTKVLNAENEKLTRAALEYTRGLPIVKSFGITDDHFGVGDPKVMDS